MFSPFTRWLKSMRANFSGARRNRPRPAARPVSSRLGMEALEAREVPATHIWDTVPNNLWSNDSNWASSAPTSGEIGGTVVAFPTSDPVITQDLAVTVDRIDFTSAGNNINLTAQLGLNGNNLTEQITSTGGNNSITGPSALALAGTVSVFRIDAGTVTIASQITNGVNGFSKTGAGTLELTTTVSNTYTGTTEIRDGVLRLNTNTVNSGVSNDIIVGDAVGAAGSAVLQLVNSQEIPNSTAITIASDGALVIGTGVNEDIANLTYNGGQFVFADISGVNDRLAVSGTVTLTGATLIATSANTNFTTGQVFTLISNAGGDAIVGTFAGLPEGAIVTVAGRQFSISYVGGTGNDVTLTALEAAAPVAPLVPFYSGATVVGTNLVLTGAGVQGGIQILQVPVGSSVIFSDLNGDGQGDVILVLPNLVLVVDGATGRFLALSADVNGDAVRDLRVFNLDGTVTTTDGKTGLLI